MSYQCLLQIVEINNYSTYGIMYLIQLTCCTVLYTSTTFNFGIMVFWYELTCQFQILLNEVKEAFKHRMDHTFQKRFIECICHHQMIIK